MWEKKLVFCIETHAINKIRFGHILSCWEINFIEDMKIYSLIFGRFHFGNSLNSAANISIRFSYQLMFIFFKVTWKKLNQKLVFVDGLLTCVVHPILLSDNFLEGINTSTTSGRGELLRIRTPDANSSFPIVGKCSPMQE